VQGRGKMRIAAVDTFILRHALDKPFGFSQWWYDARSAMLVRVTADNGMTGWGEAYGPPEPSESIVRHVLTPLILGQDPRNTLPLWERMYARTRDSGRGGMVLHALSAVDIALWDLKGQILGVSISQLLGGRFRERVQAYATGLYFRPEEDFVAGLVEEARGYVAEGFRAIKLKVGLDPDTDLRHAQAVRAAIGPDIELMVDANHAYDAATAIRLGRAFEQLDVRWFEEPVIPEDLEAYAEVARALDLPIAGGEAEFNRFGFRRLFEARTVDIVQPDLTATGGFTECQRIATLANAHGVRYLPHVWGSAIGLAAALQFIAALPPATQSLRPIEPLLELDRTPNRFRDELSIEPLRPEAGWMAIPNRPGLGITIDETKLTQYRVDQGG